MATYAALADLPLRIEDYALEGLTLGTPGGWERRTTVIRMFGAGAEGIGEDPGYEGADHEALQAAGAVLPLAGTYTLDSLSARLDELDLFPTAPSREVTRNYRRWAFEAAALDLALRQARTSLAEVLGRQPRPLRFVVSMGLGDPSTLAPVRHLLDRAPGLQFKLDAAADWDDELVAELADTSAVATVDLKGLYVGTPVDLLPDPDLYRRVAEGLPWAWIEDPNLSDAACDEILRAHRERITWDEPIHSVTDIDGLPFAPRALNFKPCRFGPLRELFAAYDACAERDIAVYGGGSFELGPGRGQIQALASLFCPDAPNDTAPTEFHVTDPAGDLPVPPLHPGLDPLGFRWAS